jgi:hypothetical protein
LFRPLPRYPAGYREDISNGLQTGCHRENVSHRVFLTTPKKEETPRGVGAQGLS